MEEAVVGAVVGVTFQVGIENVISLLREKIDLVGEFKEDLEKLKSSLIMIQSTLYDAEMQQVTSRAVKLWLKKLENLAFGAENALDEFNYQLLHEERNNRESQTTMMKKVKSIFSGSHSRDPRRKLGHKIREINQELESINQEAINFRLPMGSVGARAPGAGSDVFAGLETDSFTVDPIFIGRDNDVSRIVEMLTSIPTDQQVFSILPIFGMGGLGKTTLTRKVYHDEKIVARFATRIWVHVSTNFDPVSLFKKILSSLGSRNVEGGSREFLLKELQEALRAKTYLLVLDDVWNQDHAIWEGFINSLSGISSTRGNGIIVTTRNLEVAEIVRTLPIYELAGLPVDKCWSIIKAKTFGGGDVPSEFEIIGKNIANMCGGLPLAANIVGGLLRRKSKDDWLSIERNWLPGENNISKILKLSFDNLYFPALKKCFAYCAIFAKGHRIMRQELIELWMGEGFLQPDQENDMEALGNKFFNLLLQNSLLQCLWIGDSLNTTIYSMHDLVHDLACSVLGSCEVNDCISEGICQVRYIGLKKYGDESRQIPKEAAKYLRTLFFKGAISNGMFSHFECLHNLTLKGDHITELPISIGKLIHLRNLNIAYTRIEYLPDSTGELYLLQTLRTTDDNSFGQCCLKKLPGTLKYLISLRHLHIRRYTEFPHEVGRLTSLQTLPYFPVGKEDGQKIVELGGLKNLKGKLMIYNLEKVPDKEEAKSACLFRKPNLVRLVLQWNESKEGERNDENVLEGLQPHPNLKSLHIKGFKGTHFPSWTMNMAVRDEVEGRWVGLDNLIEISLSNCRKCEEIPMLVHLPHLKSLNLEGLTKVRSIGSSFYGACKNTVNVFPALERLKLQNMSNLKEWVGVEFAETQPCEVKAFPCLEYLKIDDCKQLLNAPSHFPGLKELDVDGVDSGLPLANICGITLTSLTKLKIGGISNGLEYLPDWLFYNNRNLMVLQIRNCPNLRELPDGLQLLNSLEELRIKWCPNLKSIPSSCSSGGESQDLTSSLRILWIIGCQGLTNLPGEIMEASAPSLEDLRLRDLTSVTSFPRVIDCLRRMSRLETLEIDNVPHFIFPEIGSLRELLIGPFSDTRDCGSFKKNVDVILQLKLQSLHKLTLSGMEDWDSLPDQLQRLTTLSWLELRDFGIETLPEWFQNLSALSRLELHNFGIETLPEWLGNLSSLWSLSLRQCKKFRSMPSEEAMQRLTKLKFLWIEACPELEEGCEMEQQNDDSDSDSDSKWLSKISHIQNVRVGFHEFVYGKRQDRRKWA